MPADSFTLYDDAVKRRIALERYSNDQIRRTLPFLKEVERDLMGRIAQLRNEALDRAGRIRLASQEKLLASVQSVYAETYAKLNDRIQSGLTRLAGSEAERVSEALGAVAKSAGLQFTTNELTATSAFEIAAAKPMQGALLQDWLSDIEPSHRKRVEQALRISFAEGESLETAMNRLRNATKLNERGLAALIRTSNSHIAASVTEATYEANADIIEGVEWVSTLDSRTTSICRSRDGKRYKVGEGPRPPAHIGCRSTTVAVLIGMEPAPRQTYNEWLKRQPAKVQDDILGPARGKLFRSGEMSVDRFVDMKGKTLTLDELGAKQGGTIFSNFATQIQTAGARNAADFLGIEPSDVGRLAERMMGRAGPAIVAEGAANNIPVKLTLTGSKTYVNLRGAKGFAKIEVVGEGFRMERVFTRTGRTLEVENKLLSMHEDLQGKGYATQILRGSIAEYEALGVKRVWVTANIDVGGYTWARFGYSPVNPAEFVAEVRNSARLKRQTGKLSRDDEDLIDRVLSRSDNLDRLPADLARIKNANGKEIGKEALLGTYWEGYLDMTDAKALAYFKKVVGG